MATSVQSHSLSQRIAAYLTILEWLPRYDRALLRPDVIAALTMWAVVVPQAIAYAQLAGLPPQAGLFAGAAALVGYALFGTSRQAIVNPTSATAAISASVVTAVALGDASKFGPLSAVLAYSLSGIIFRAGIGADGIHFPFYFARGPDRLFVRVGADDHHRSGTQTVGNSERKWRLFRKTVASHYPAQ